MKKNYQWSRAGFHFIWAFGFIFFVQVLMLSTRQLDLLVGVSMVCIVSTDLIRVWLYNTLTSQTSQKHTKKSKVHDHIETMLTAFINCFPMRREEFDKPAAITSFLLGVGTTYFVLVHMLHMPVIIPFMACIILATGDPAARVTGIHYGGPKISSKSRRTWAGTIGFFCASIAMLQFTSVLNLWFPLYFNHVTLGELLLLQVLGCFVGAIVEAIIPRFDNFFIPFVSGIAMSVLYSFY